VLCKNKKLIQQRWQNDVSKKRIKKKGPRGKKNNPAGRKHFLRRQAKKTNLLHVTTRVPRLPREKKMVCEKWWLCGKKKLCVKDGA